MNIFALDKNPKIAAKYHCDKHVVKMIVESAQMLCTNKQFYNETAPYKKCFVNHPCTIWSRENISNYKWLCSLALNLCEEYTKRYGKIHKTQSIIEYCTNNPPPLPDGKLTNFACAMPEYCKTSKDPVQNYRTYYIQEKRGFAKWKNGKIPKWFNIKIK